LNKDLYNLVNLKKALISKSIGIKDIEPIVDIQKKPLHLPNNIDNLKKIVSQCHLCPLSKKRTNVVFSEGFTSSSLMFIR